MFLFLIFPSLFLIKKEKPQCLKLPGGISDIILKFIYFGAFSEFIVNFCLYFYIFTI